MTGKPESTALWRNPSRSIRGRFSALSQVLNVGAMLLDEHAEVEFANPAALDLIGARGEADAADAWSACLSDELRGRLVAMESGGAPLRAQLVGRHDDQPIPLRVEAYRLDEDDGNGFLVLLKAKHAGDILEADLVQASQMRNLVKRFASATHEIRAPLNALSLNCHLLQTALDESGGDTGPAREHVDVIVSELKRLNGLLNELIEETRPPVSQQTSFDLVLLVEQVTKLVHPYAESRGVKPVNRLGSDAIWVNGYPDRLKQAVLNILNNAIEAMPEGGTLTVTTASTDASATVEIADTGKGMPAEMLDDIFRLHYSTKKSGSGIGLYVARLVAESHGGDLLVESAEDAGSTFTLMLPRA
ncbi:HAMP domain-containing histidine kinase [Burkholderia sp. FERM BP-3421]|jgi:signal transduction histidine kinase|uniref:two-component system sensor histidine kinase NtrB n=1 Tax=Burkholderia sp. FERM BP-3421 TaxID=1494466 RepID=UPI00235EC927|nr:PAS domain-containing sensor histidine kinase [Burkholderia sp. FERM BP-3421]WDD92922.1 HAMP domain-containing histidine kinase [Burkholderia sp. FERM BP-3421]